MFLFDLENTEANPHYNSLQISNGERQFSFLQSIITAAVATEHGLVSKAILEALNFHAIACLHQYAGVYRPSQVVIKNSAGEVTFLPAPPDQVHSLMDGFISEINANWLTVDPIYLSAFVLWRLCNIHPFVNGNGRTARAACYYTLCVRFGGLLPGQEFVPTLLKQSAEYIPALKVADSTAAAGNLDLSMLVMLLQKLITQQLSSVTPS